MLCVDSRCPTTRSSLWAEVWCDLWLAVTCWRPELHGAGPSLTCVLRLLELRASVSHSRALAFKVFYACVCLCAPTCTSVCIVNFWTPKGPSVLQLLSHNSVVWYLSCGALVPSRLLFSEVLDPSWIVQGLSSTSHTWVSVCVDAPFSSYRF